LQFADLGDSGFMPEEQLCSKQTAADLKILIEVRNRAFPATAVSAFRRTLMNTIAHSPKKMLNQLKLSSGSYSSFGLFLDGDCCSGDSHVTPMFSQ